MTHFRRLPIKRLAACTLGKMVQNDPHSPGDVLAPYLRAAHVQPHGRLVDLAEQPMWFSPTELRALDLRVNDVVVVEGGAGYGRSATIADNMAGWGFQNSIIRVRAQAERAEGRFIDYSIQSALSSGEIENLCNTATIPHFTAEKVAALEVPALPVEQQRAIADFLDEQTSRIDTLIDKQTQLIATLLERRTVIRANLATGTLRTSGVPLIASGLPWASLIPEGWSVAPLTALAVLESGHTPSRSRPELWTECHIPWISLNDVSSLTTSEYIAHTANKISDAGVANSSARVLPAGTVVLSRDATIGRSSIMAVPMATSQHFAAWVCGPRIAARYLWLLFTSAMQSHFDTLTDGSTIKTIGMGDLRSFKVPVPPLDEQRRIVTDAEVETAKIDTLITKTEQHIALAKERRSALITAAVTGQIDVRTAGRVERVSA